MLFLSNGFIPPAATIDSIVIIHGQQSFVTEEKIARSFGGGGIPESPISIFFSHIPTIPQFQKHSVISDIILDYYSVNYDTTY
jgi:hypothetical protein